MCPYLTMPLHFCENLWSLTEADAVDAQPRSPMYLLPAAASATANDSHCSFLRRSALEKWELLTRRCLPVM